MRLFALCLVIFFYYWTATAPSEMFDSSHNVTNFYNSLTTSLLNGKTNLDVNVSEGFFNLSDPYDPNLNRIYRGRGIHDLSFYKGKFYLYFGVVPAILLYIPYRLITHNYLSDYLVVFIFMTFSFLLLSYALSRFKEKYFQEIPSWILNLFILVLGFSNLAGYMLRRSMQYQVSITGNVFCLSLAIWFLYKAFDEEDKKVISLILSSVFLGLSVGCRPPSIIIGFVLIPLIILIQKLNKKQILLFLSPYFLILFMLGIYNYIRFDNPLDFGMQYQLTIVNFQSPSIHLLSLKPFLANLYFNFFNPINIDSSFPFLHAVPLHLFKFENYPLGIERIVGLFFLLPHILFLFFFPRNLFLHLIQESKESLLLLVNFIPFVFSSVFVLFFSYVTLRFMTEFISFGLICSAISFFYIYRTSKYKSILSFILIVFSLYSIICGFAISIEGCDFVPTGLISNDPESYNALSEFFEPISKFITFCK